MTDRVSTLLGGRRERLERLLGRKMNVPRTDARPPLSTKVRSFLREEAEDLYWNELEWEHITDEEALEEGPLTELAFPGFLAFVRGLLLAEVMPDALAPASPRPEVVEDVLGFLAARVVELEDGLASSEADGEERMDTELDMTSRLIDLVLYQFHGLRSWRRRAHRRTTPGRILTSGAEWVRSPPPRGRAARTWRGRPCWSPTGAVRGWRQRTRWRHFAAPWWTGRRTCWRWTSASRGTARWWSSTTRPWIGPPTDPARWASFRLGELQRPGRRLPLRRSEGRIPRSGDGGQGAPLRRRADLVPQSPHERGVQGAPGGRTPGLDRTAPRRRGSGPGGRGVRTLPPGRTRIPGAVGREPPSHPALLAPASPSGRWALHARAPTFCRCPRPGRGAASSRRDSSGKPIGATSRSRCGRWTRRTPCAGSSRWVWTAYRRTGPTAWPGSWANCSGALRRRGFHRAPASDERAAAPGRTASSTAARPGAPGRRRHGGGGVSGGVDSMSLLHLLRFPAARRGSASWPPMWITACVRTARRMRPGSGA